MTAVSLYRSFDPDVQVSALRPFPPNSQNAEQCRTTPEDIIWSI